MVMTCVSATVLDAARRVRADLLARGKTQRDLAGECALASMMLAEAIGDVAALRTGFFMQRCMFMGRRGRYPHSHAWCRIKDAIVDVTATQFGRYPAIYVVATNATDRYVECANGADAVSEVMTAWRCGEVPEYRRIRRRLREMDDAA